MTGGAARVVELVVREDRGVERRRTLVRGGVPFPSGSLAEVAELAVAETCGDRVPAHLRMAERWPDGSVRWLGVTFLADVPAGGSARYALVRTGEQGRARSSTFDVVVGRVDVLGAPPFAVTTPFQVTGFPHLTSIEVGVVDAAGVRYGGGYEPPEVVEDNEVCGRIRVAGMLQAAGSEPGIDVELDLLAVAGQPLLELECRLVNRRPEPIELREWTIRLGLDGGEIGRCGHFDAIHRTTRPFSLRQTGEGYLTGVFAASDVLSCADEWTDDSASSYWEELEWAELHGRLGSGWIDVEAADGTGVTVSVARFADNYPAELEWTGDAIVLHARPEWADPVRIHPGMAPAVRLELRARERFDYGVPRTAATFDAPPRLDVPALVADSGAVDVFPHRPDAYPRLEAWIRERVFQWCETGQARGFLDRGDWLSAPMGQRWSFTANNEHDALYALCLHYLRSGEPAYLASASSYGDHVVDIDLIHSSAANDFEHGALRAHGREHVHYVNARTADSEVRTSVDTGHQWVEGLLLLGAITADPRYTDAAHKVGAALVRLVELGWARPEPGPRNAGWPLIALSALVRSTGDPAFLDAARSVAADALAAQESEGGWTIRLGFLRSYCAWQNAILVTGLGRLAAVDPSPLAGLQSGFERAAHALLDRGRLPDGSFSYVDHPDYRWPWSTGLVREALCVAYDLLDDERFLRAGLGGGTSWYPLASSAVTNNEIAEWRGHLPFLARADRADLLVDLPRIGSEAL